MADDLFGGPPEPPPYHRPAAPPREARRQFGPRRQAPPPPPPSPLLRQCRAADLQSGMIVRVLTPSATARIKEAYELPTSSIERTLEGGDPKPAIFVRMMYMDGEKRGETVTTMLHPDDRVRL